MGASCTSLSCSSKKNQKSQKANILRRPTANDFSLEEDNDGTDQPLNPRVVVPPDNEQARIGVYF
jgi:hypothetical protein